jgi:8-amino-7-oxononanoate synthase
MPDFPKKLTQKIGKRTADNALRELPNRHNLVDFSSNDYLGFSRATWIKDRAQNILNSNDFKNGATGSRLLTGNHNLYQELEHQLVNFHDCKAALIFNSGYDANLGFFGSVPQRGDFIFYDEFAHASIRDGIQLSNAKNYKFRHNDLSDLKSKVELSVRAKSRTLDSEIYVVTESVFSMDGDSPNLKELVNFCRDNNYRLIFDEAHAAGVFGNGKGLCVEQEIHKQVFARIITFGKALGCHGASILGSSQLKEYLVNFARSFIYTTALPPHSVATIIASYNLLSSKKGISNQHKLLENITYFKNELKENGLQNHFIESNSAIQCVTIPGNANVKTVSIMLHGKGFDVKPILSPTVAKGEERLRFCLHAFNTKEEIRLILNTLAKNL